MYTFAVRVHCHSVSMQGKPHAILLVFRRLAGINALTPL